MKKYKKHLKLNWKGHTLKKGADPETEKVDLQLETMVINLKGNISG